MDRINYLLKNNSVILGKNNRYKNREELKENLFDNDFIILCPEYSQGYYNMIEIKKNNSSFIKIIKKIQQFYNVQNKMGDHKFLESFIKVKFNDNIFALRFGS